MPPISIRTVAAAAVAVLALTGCQSGGGDKPAQVTSPPPAGNGVAALSADEILQRAKTSLTAARSYRVNGTMIDGGQTSQLDFSVDGADLTGKMAFGSMEVELLAVGNDRFLRGNEEFFVQGLGPEQGAAVGKVFAGRWIAGADNDPSFASLFTIGTVEEILRPTGTLSKGEEKEIGGVPAIGLKDSADPDGVFWIATTGEPYPLRLSNAKSNAELVISGVGEPVTGITEPAADEIIDLEQLTSK